MYIIEFLSAASKSNEYNSVIFSGQWRWQQFDLDAPPFRLYFWYLLLPSDHAPKKAEAAASGNDRYSED
jgi:hypothetical protein